jgi:hypothetical protein
MSLSAQKHFEVADQARFAEASGDWNPMHMDPLAARRTQMGAPVIHGMHLALSCLDAFSQMSNDPPSLTGISIHFVKPAFVGETLTFTASDLDPLKLMAQVEGVRVMTIDLTKGPTEKAFDGSKDAPTLAPGVRIPRERSFGEIEKAAGVRERIVLSNGSEKLFPSAARWIGKDRVNALASFSTLVGMECPGLHSIFVSLNIELTEDGPLNHLEYAVVSTDDRFRRVKMSVSGGGWKGLLDAAVRNPPVLQPSLGEMARKVPSGSFKGQRVLVVGGSRGIGEYTAKAVAAGGAQVVLTYAVGLEEAQALVAEMKEFGSEAEHLPFDVRFPAEAQLDRLTFSPTHVYYFATCRISRPRKDAFDPALYQEFQQFYVKGFYDLCSALRKRTDGFFVFYPSSIYVNPEGRPKGLAEYAMAKGEGEALCADLSQLLPGVEARVKRLPRLPTDQTASLGPTSGEESMDILLPLIREMQGG